MEQGLIAALIVVLGFAALLALDIIRAAAVSYFSRRQLLSAQKHTEARLGS